jgi:hypothetical protein
MKQLLLTFFAFILCYSLFFDSETASSSADELNYIYEKASPGIYSAKDTFSRAPENVQAHCLLPSEKSRCFRRF